MKHKETLQRRRKGKRVRATAKLCRTGRQRAGIGAPCQLHTPATAGPSLDRQPPASQNKESPPTEPARQEAAPAENGTTTPNDQQAVALTTEQLDKLATLGKLGFTVTADDVAKLLDVPAETVRSYLTTPAGAAAWARARAEGRTELLAVIRRQALEGSAQAQKLLTGLLDRDDTISMGDQRITTSDICLLLGRSASSVVRHASEGDFPRPGPDDRLSVRDVFRSIADLWEKLTKARQDVARLEKLIQPGRIEEAEARRQAAVELARRRRRENDEAEGRLVAANEVRATVEKLGRTIRDESRAMVDSLILKLGFSKAGTAHLEAARTAFLRRTAAIMDEEEAAYPAEPPTPTAHEAPSA